MRTSLTTLSALLLALASIALLTRVSSVPGPPTATKPTTTTADAHVQRVECGCALEEIGHCGNYIEVDGAFVEVGGDLGLGKMEWCQKSGLKAEAEGEMKDGKFVATSLTIVP